MFLGWLSTKIATILLLCWTKWPPILKIEIIFKRHLLLDQWPDFKIISQKCTLGNPLPKLLKWFCSTEQNGRQSLKLKTFSFFFFFFFLIRWFLSSEKYSHFSYFPTKTHVVVPVEGRDAFNEYPQHMFLRRSEKILCAYPSFDWSYVYELEWIQWWQTMRSELRLRGICGRD